LSLIYLLPFSNLNVPTGRSLCGFTRVVKVLFREMEDDDKEEDDFVNDFPVVEFDLNLDNTLDILESLDPI